MSESELLSTQELKELASLSCLEGTRLDLEALRGDLLQVIEFVSHVQELDLEPEGPLIREMSPHRTVLREDQISGEEQACAKEDLPYYDKESGYFQAPPILRRSEDA